MSRKTNTFLLVIFCLYLFPIVINRFGIFNYLLLYGSASLYILINFNIFSNLFRYVTRKEFWDIFILLILIFISILYPFFHATYDFSYTDVVLAIIRKTIILTFLLILLIRYHNEKADTNLFMKYFIYATSIYVLGTLFFTLFPSIREYWKNILGVNTYLENLYKSYGYTTRFGWSGFSGFRQSLNCTLSIIFAMILIFDSKILSKEKQVIKINLLICLIGNMLYGRMGLLTSLSCLLLAFLYYRKINLLKFSRFILLSIFFLYIINYLKNSFIVAHDWYYWAIGPFINFLKTGDFSNYSAYHLLNDMIFIPEMKTIFLGDGRYVDLNLGTYYKQTDSGIMRQILFWGIIGTTLSYTLVVRTITSINNQLFIFKFLLLLSFVIFEFKGEVFYEYIPIFFILGILSKRVVQQNITLEGDDLY